jgi:hypothetical protein
VRKSRKNPHKRILDFSEGPNAQELESDPESSVDFLMCLEQLRVNLFDELTIYLQFEPSVWEVAQYFSNSVNDCAS